MPPVTSGSAGPCPISRESVSSSSHSSMERWIRSVASASGCSRATLLIHQSSRFTLKGTLAANAAFFTAARNRARSRPATLGSRMLQQRSHGPNAEFLLWRLGAYSSPTVSNSWNRARCSAENGRLDVPFGPQWYSIAQEAQSTSRRTQTPGKRCRHPSKLHHPTMIVGDAARFYQQLRLCLDCVRPRGQYSPMAALG